MTSASASNGVVCSLNACPASNANAVTLPPPFLIIVRLTTAPGWYCTSAAWAITPSNSTAALRSAFMRFSRLMPAHARRTRTVEYHRVVLTFDDQEACKATLEPRQRVVHE